MPIVNKQSPTSKPAAVARPQSVIDRIGQYSNQDYIRMLIYGRSKTGKTRTISTFPGPILWIICSGGNESGELKSVSAEAKKNIKPVTLYHSSEMRDLINHVKASSGRYKTVVQDHVSGLQDKILSEILGLDKLPEQMTWGTATRDQFMACGTQCREYLRSFLGLPANTILVGQEKSPKEIEDNGGDLLLPIVGVDLMPSLAGWLYPAVDFIVQMCKMPKKERKEFKGKDGKVVVQEKTIAGADYCLRTGPDSVYTTGFREPGTGLVPQFIVNPTYAKIKKVLDGKWTNKDF